MSEQEEGKVKKKKKKKCAWDHTVILQKIIEEEKS